MPRLYRALWLGVLLALGSYLALTLWLAFSGIFFPYQLDYGEGIVLWFTHQLALGHSIYKGLEGLPYASSNYPPLAMLLAAPFRALFGDSYIGGRWLNFAATILVSAFIFRIVRDETRPSPPTPLPRGPGPRHAGFAAALAALFFLASTYIYHWIPLFRVDLIGLGFTVAGIFFVWRWEKAVASPRSSVADGSFPATWSLGLAALFFLCALYTKHSLFSAPVAGVIAIFLRNRRAGVMFALALGLSGGIIFALLDIATNRGLEFGLITSNATVWAWRIFLSLMANFLFTYAVLLALGAWAWWQRVRTKQVGALEIYAVAAMLSLALTGREGAFENYFFEAIVVVCIFAGIAMAPWLGRGLRPPLWVPLALLVQLVLFAYDHHPALAGNLFNITHEGNEHLAPLVQQAVGTVISEDMGLLVTNNQPVDYYTFQYSTLARAGKWDQHWELENLRAGKFPLVILLKGTREDVDHFGNFTRAFVSALDYGYGVLTADAHYVAYAPAHLQHLRGDDFDGKLQLIGWTLAPEQFITDSPGLRGGETLTLDVVWRAEQKLNARYTSFAHLENATGGVVAQDDHEPQRGIYPTTHWASDEMVRDTYTLHVPASLSAGDYFLRVGWYDSTTQDRLGVKSGNDFVELQTWQVTR